MVGPRAQRTIVRSDDRWDLVHASGSLRCRPFSRTGGGSARRRLGGTEISDLVRPAERLHARGHRDRRGRSAYFGSRTTGAIYKADLRTGQGEVINEGPGTPSLGLKVKRNRLFVAGGTAGTARVLDARTGKLLKSYTLATGNSFVNDVVLTRDAAYFTDSTNPVLYRLDLRRWGGCPPRPSRSR